MNKVILLGRLTKDPEIRYSQSADPMCVSRFTLAVDRRFKKEGEPDADFIFCVAFRRTAEFMERYIKKGMMVSVCGSLQVRSYEDNTGQRKWSTEVIAEEVNFAESRAAFEARMAKGDSDYSAVPPPPQSEPEGFKAITQSIDEDDDLPF
ncbi:MAG: single-stranded DNA-binding protein [Defluviitaleaceae bacterium]|nr:single-stranded DNA-binding protein [Defluviitaleaceae bacterium]MCL2262947.1 single-stranded DNA-binding protein [Defluviitaleaceae bacterium]